MQCHRSGRRALRRWHCHKGCHKGGRLFEASGATGQITGVTKHGLDRIIGRGIKPSQILDAVRGGEAITIIDNLGRVSFRFVGPAATVVLNEAGKIITAWAKGW